MEKMLLLLLLLPMMTKTAMQTLVMTSITTMVLLLLLMMMKGEIRMMKMEMKMTILSAYETYPTRYRVGKHKLTHITPGHVFSVSGQKTDQVTRCYEVVTGDKTRAKGSRAEGGK